MVGHIFDRSVRNLKPTIIFIWPPNETQVKVTIVYPSRNVAIPTLHDKQPPLA